MAFTIKPLSAKATATGSGNASNFGKATHVLAVNTADSSTYLVTRDNASDTTLGTFTLPPNAMMIVVKEMTDKLYGAHNAVEFTAVAASGI